MRSGQWTQWKSCERGGDLIGLRVLITNIHLWPPSGTVIYVRDLAMELQRQGHLPIVFSTTSGDVSNSLRRAGVVVTDSLDPIGESPDIIHGHHYAPTILAIQKWPSTPAIYVCHDHSSLHDRTPVHPSIRSYFGVSRVCVERLVAEGAPADRTGLLLNFVDLDRFRPRTDLPDRPRRALVFSNYARQGTQLAAVTEACRRAGIELDVIGAGVARVVTQPEQLIGQYDIVFAKAKAAMEAMAVGAAVVLCDFPGAGPLVTSANFHDLRPLNFGFEALREPLGPEHLQQEIARYDSRDAAEVRDLIRSEAGLTTAVEGLIAIYRGVVGERVIVTAETNAQAWGLRDRLFLRLSRGWGSASASQRQAILALPGARVISRWLRRLLGSGGT